MGLRIRLFSLTAMLVFMFSTVSFAEEYKVFKSDDFGFSMKYPASWFKIDKPKANYYVVFQSPDKTDNARNRIHVAAHEPVKDPLKVFLTELRNGVKEMQQGAAQGKADAQQVKIIDEGEFRCEVPGAYYFFIQAFEAKLNVWLDIVIVFYKHNQTLLRISCLAPSTMMEKMQPVFNEVLTSVAFSPQGSPAAGQPKPATPASTTVAPEQEEDISVPSQPAESEVRRPAAPAPPATQRTAPRGPARGLERPPAGGGIVEEQQ